MIKPCAFAGKKTRKMVLFATRRRAPLDDHPVERLFGAFTKVILRSSAVGKRHFLWIYSGSSDFGSRSQVPVPVQLRLLS